MCDCLWLAEKLLQKRRRFSCLQSRLVFFCETKSTIYTKSSHYWFLIRKNNIHNATTHFALRTFVTLCKNFCLYLDVETRSPGTKTARLKDIRINVINWFCVISKVEITWSNIGRNDFFLSFTENNVHLQRGDEFWTFQTLLEKNSKVILITQTPGTRFVWRVQKINQLNNDFIKTTIRIENAAHRTCLIVIPLYATANRLL